jgi:alpha-galactosidase
MPDVEPALIHWRGCGVSVLIDCQGDGLPRILYWGADLGSLADEDLVSVALASLPHQGSNQANARVDVSVLPEQSRGWMGTPVPFG